MTNYVFSTSTTVMELTDSSGKEVLRVGVSVHGLDFQVDLLKDECTLLEASVFAVPEGYDKADLLKNGAPTTLSLATLTASGGVCKVCIFNNSYIPDYVGVMHNICREFTNNLTRHLGVCPFKTFELDTSNGFSSEVPVDTNTVSYEISRIEVPVDFKSDFCVPLLLTMGGHTYFSDVQTDYKTYFEAAIFQVPSEDIENFASIGVRPKARIADVYGNIESMSIHLLERDENSEAFYSLKENGRTFAEALSSYTLTTLSGEFKQNTLNIGSPRSLKTR